MTLAAAMNATDFDLKAAAKAAGYDWADKRNEKNSEYGRKAFLRALENSDDVKAAIVAKVNELNDAGAIFIVSHSGGKDSQALYQVIKAIVPQERIIVIHALLPEVDWDGIPQHIMATIDAGTEYHEVVAVNKAGETKTFFDMVEASALRLSRQGRSDKVSPWPSPATRQCTSDLKRGPIEKAIRHALKARGAKVVVDCTGIRSDESCQRKNAPRFEKHVSQSVAGRSWYRWAAIKDMTTADVFQTIADAGQKPHAAYAKGMSRLSCSFCIMASKCDLRTAATLRPALYERYVETEKQVGKTMMMSRLPLEEHVGMTVAEAKAASAAPQADDLNEKEQMVLVELTERETSMHLNELAATLFAADWSSRPVWAKRQVSNSVRRLVSRGLVVQTGRGTYAAA